MQETEFNLLDEKWICVVGAGCEAEQVSLTDALLKAHTFADFGGELPAQDVAVLRLLLAILHTVFSRVDENGIACPLETVDDAFDRWKALWDRGSFPERPLLEYLTAWHERFWLFHPDRPFYQVNDAKIGTTYTTAKLDGELSESNNKVKLFPVQTGDAKTHMDYGEAARWLLYQNAFDDNSSKPKGKNLPAPGIGWLGKLGLVQAVGKNLFETLMLNLTLLDDNGQLWTEGNRPVWELDEPRSQERTEIAIPGNQAELLTLQSRRLLLQREDGRVTGYSLLGGDFFPKEDSTGEMMTIWALREDKKAGTAKYFQPRRHNPDRLIWQEFSAIITGSEVRCPGIVKWLKELQSAGCLPRHQMLTFRIASVQYGSSDYFATDVFADELSLHANLLSELGFIWQNRIVEEIDLCEQCAKQIGWLAANLDRAAGDRKGSHQGLARERFYSAVDMPFRSWLASLDAEMDDAQRDDKVFAWRAQARAIALKLGADMIAGIDSTAFTGRTLKEKKNGKDIEYHYSAPEAWLSFQAGLNKTYPAGKTREVKG